MAGADSIVMHVMPIMERVLYIAVFEKLMFGKTVKIREIDGCYFAKILLL
jgi:hypothetical protein